MYKIKKIIKPEYIEHFRRMFGYIPYEGMVITDDRKRTFINLNKKCQIQSL